MRFSRVTAGLGPPVLEQFRSFRVIFDYTRGKAVASIRLDMPLPEETGFGGRITCERIFETTGQGITTSLISALR